MIHKCDLPKDDFGDCDVHVKCDDDCQALEKPTNLEEALATLRHYETHSWLHACAMCGS